MVRTQESQRGGKLMGLLKIMVFLYSSTQGHHGTNLGIFFHCVTKFLPFYYIMTIQKIHKCTLIVFPLRIKNLCLVISLFSAPLHRKTSRKLSGCCLYFLTYIHPFPFPISSSVQPGFSPIIKFHWTCCLQSQWPLRCQIQRTFSVFPLVWKQSPFLTSVTISSSGYFPTLLLATPSKFLLLAFPPLPKLKYWYSSGFCLGLSSSFFIQLLLSDFIHSHYFDYYLYVKCSFIYISGPYLFPGLQTSSPICLLDNP